MTAKQFRILGVVVLLAGLAAAVTIHFTAAPEKRLGLLGIDIPTHRDRHELERMGGKSYVLFKDLDDWFSSLWHGRRLGSTIGVLSIAGFLLCRGLARVQEDYEASEAQELTMSDEVPGPTPTSGPRAPERPPHQR